MDANTFSVYLRNKVKNFCLRFDNSYHIKLFKEYLNTLGYKVVEIPSEELLEACSRGNLFSKALYWTSYEATVWKAAEKRKLSCPFVMVTDSKQCKAAEDWIGPSEFEILTVATKRLEEKGIRFEPDAWKMLVDSHRDATGKIQDPIGLWNSAYAVGLQANENRVTLAIVRTVIGYKAQIWDLFNALLARNSRATLQAMFILTEEHEPITLCLGLEKMLCDLMNVMDARAKKMTSDQYAELNKMHPFRAKKVFEQAAAVKIDTVHTLLNCLVTMEIRLKNVGDLTKSEIFKQEIMLWLGL